MTFAAAKIDLRLSAQAGLEAPEHLNLRGLVPDPNDLHAGAPALRLLILGVLIVLLLASAITLIYSDRAWARRSVPLPRSLRRRLASHSVASELAEDERERTDRLRALHIAG